MIPPSSQPPISPVRSPGECVAKTFATTSSREMGSSSSQSSSTHRGVRQITACLPRSRYRQWYVQTSSSATLSSRSSPSASISLSVHRPQGRSISSQHCREPVGTPTGSGAYVLIAPSQSTSSCKPAIPTSAASHLTSPTGPSNSRAITSSSQPTRPCRPSSPNHHLWPDGANLIPTRHGWTPL